MNRHGRLGIYLPVLIISILATVTLRTVACFLYYDTDTGYFDSKTLIGISSCILAGAAFFLFTHIFFSEHGRVLTASFSGPETYVPTGITVIALLLFGAHSFEKFLSSDLSIKSIRMLAIIEVLLVLLSLFAAAHFILTALLTERASVSRAAFGICASAFFALVAIYLYFDPSTPINAPSKITDQMAYLFTALFLLYEIRISLGRELWAAYRTFGLISALLTAYSSVPGIIYYLAGKGELSESIYGTVLTLTLFIFIFCRLVLSSRIKEDCESPSVTRLRSASQLRCAEIESRSLLSAAAHELERTEEGEGEYGENRDVSYSEASNGIEADENGKDAFEPIQLTFGSDDGIRLLNGEDGIQMLNTADDTDAEADGETVRTEEE